MPFSLWVLLSNNNALLTTETMAYALSIFTAYYILLYCLLHSVLRVTRPMLFADITAQSIKCGS